MIYAVGREAPVLDVEPIFNSSLDLLIVGKSPSLQNFPEFPVVFKCLLVRYRWQCFGDPGYVPNPLKLQAIEWSKM
ncbi:hypothetical protein TNCV_2381561 [Trichonephila clavipes]|nr:hypothetical protein TNCV_2381561 [Trichonephila clavipes]